MHKFKSLQTFYWKEETFYILDQRLLPHRVEYLPCKNHHDVIAAICTLAVRGAPAIGIAAAFAMALCGFQSLPECSSYERLKARLAEASQELLASRPTAVNLAWALQRIEKWLSMNDHLTPREIAAGLLEEAEKIFKEDVEHNRMIGKNGSALVPEGASILTHCNAGSLATGGFGTALGVIRAAAQEGKNIHVYIDETRPLLQGARLSSFEMFYENIPATLIIDSCAAYLMKKGQVDLIVVGADRIAGNGDCANKIGTYALAVLASYHKIPFYIAAPLSTIDLELSSGDKIIIEERSSEEITSFAGNSVAPENTSVFNPAFDVTPAGLITALVTEKGIVYKPDQEKLYKLCTKV